MFFPWMNEIIGILRILRILGAIEILRVIEYSELSTMRDFQEGEAHMAGFIGELSLFWNFHYSYFLFSNPRLPQARSQKETAG